MVKLLTTQLLLLITCITVSAQNLTYENIAEHPRLLLKAGEEQRIAKLLEDERNVYLKNAHEAILEFAESVIGKPYVVRPDSGHILSRSREVEKRVFYLSYAYRMTGDVRYAKRAEEEMLNACKWKDWDPDHWLDTAEVMTGLAIGYDWLYSYLSQESKDQIVDALLNKGLRTAEGRRWYNVDYNWNQVCNSAMIGTSLALYELIPDEAEHYIEKSILSNPKAMAVYAPDGAYPEGYGYWNYGTSYQILMIEFVRTALGQELGIEKSPGFLESPKFIQMMVTPMGKPYSFYDSITDQVMMPMLFWFAKECNDISLCWSAYDLLNRKMTRSYTHKEVARYLPCVMIYASQLDLSNIEKPTRKVFHANGRTPVYLYRSGWDSPMDTYLGVKGGLTQGNHSHMDNGSFIFEKNGVQWSTDLGGQSYGSFYKHNISIWDFTQESQRWGCYRMSNNAHTTLIIDDAYHNAFGKAEIIETISANGEKGCVVNMGPTLSPYVTEATRTISLNKDDSIVSINDVLTVEESSDHILKWNMITKAAPSIESQNSILLSRNGHLMRLELVSGQKVTPMIQSAKSKNVYDLPNYGVSRVGFVIHLPAGQTCDIMVKLTTIQ